MLHPALRLLAARPQWLGEHAQAYAELVAAEVEVAAAQTRRALLLGTVALAAVGVAATLAGVGLMLWAVTPTLLPTTQAFLLAVPMLPLGVAGVAWLAQRRSWRTATFAALREQLQADLAMLREGSPP